MAEKSKDKEKETARKVKAVIADPKNKGKSVGIKK